jgi:SanA protein
MRFIKMLLHILFYAFAASVLVIGIARLYVEFVTAPSIFKLAQPPQSRVAIVYGAGLYRDGSPTPVLRDRVATAAALYFEGRVNKILMSGDNRFEYYNEPGAMKEYAVQLGVPSDAIVLDFAGRRTYDTCYRAKAIFGLDQAILVTQRFHLPRAIFTCNNLGLKVTGVEADRRTYLRRSQAIWMVRETFATVVAVWEVWVSHPVPVLGNPEPIFPGEIVGFDQLHQ